MSREVLAHLGSEDGVSIRATGAVFPHDMTEAEFRPVFKKLRKFHSASNWIIGDAINFAASKAWGSTYNEMLAATDREYGTLANYAAVCFAVDFSRRREQLSFTHHVQVAALAPSDQVKWLDKAETNEWSVSELRCELRRSSATRARGAKVASGFILKPRVAELLRFLQMQDHDDEGQARRIEQDLRPLVEVYDCHYRRLRPGQGTPTPGKESLRAASQNR